VGFGRLFEGCVQVLTRNGGICYRFGYNAVGGLSSIGVWCFGYSPGASWSRVQGFGEVFAVFSD
jgi:hypothetical protein